MQLYSYPRSIALALLVSLTALLGGCETTGSGGGSAANLSADWRSLLNRAERTSNPLEAARLRLNAASILQRDDPVRAVELLALIDPTLLNAGQSDIYHRLTAQQYADALAHDAALASLTQIGDRRAADWLLMADTCDALDLHHCAADALIAAGELLPSGERPVDLHARIWQALNRSKQAPPAFTNTTQHGWWLLQQAMRRATSLSAQMDAWRRWRTLNSNHPAALDPPPGVARLASFRPPNIAVLLPLSGDLAAAGQAVQSGLVAAFLNEPAARRSRVQFFDSAGTEPGALWESVLQSQPQVVVGPLLKSRVDALVEIAQYTAVPLLTLNYHTLSVPEQSPLYQLGIAIEDEATSLATAVFGDGHERVAIVHGSARWSQRALVRFQEYWPAGLTVAGFDSISGLTQAVGQAMQTDLSEVRKTEIANIIGHNVEFLPRSRQDLDAIVALTNNVESKALIPALQFHFGDKLPVYATSQAVRRGTIADLPGFAITELPLLSATNSKPMRDIVSTYDLANSSLADLYALGFDAYQLANWLPGLQNADQFGFPGASGYVWLDAGGVFRREVPLSARNAAGD